MNVNAPTVKQFVARLEPWKVLAALIVGFATGIYGTVVWIHTSAQNAVLDEKFLTTLSARVRPVCIFNTRGSIETDLGAGEYIDDIQVTPVPQNFGFEIVIKAKRHLAYAPLVSALDVGLFQQSATRGKMYEWTILLCPQTTDNTAVLGLGGGVMDTNRVYHFKLEVLH